MKKLRPRNITRTMDVTTCVVTLYERETKHMNDVTAYVTGYTDPDEIETYLANLYNTNKFVMLDYSVIRKQVIKVTMNEETFRISADSWEVISDEVIKTTTVELEG